MTSKAIRTIKKKTNEKYTCLLVFAIKMFISLDKQCEQEINVHDSGYRYFSDMTYHNIGDC